MNLRIKQQIVNILDSLRPYEVLEIRVDNQGKPNYFLVTRTQKIVISENVDN